MLNMFKVNNKDIRTTSLTWRRSAVFIVNFKHVSHLFLVFLLVSMSKQKLVGPVLSSVNFFLGSWGLTKEIPIFTTLHHSHCGVTNAQKQPFVFVLQKKRKHLQATASLTGKMPMISGRRYFIFQPFEVSDFDW